jgi:AmmeMemoRadiSam system protein B
LVKNRPHPHNLLIYEELISFSLKHRGTRFRYTYYTETDNDNRPIQLSKSNEDQISRPIYESIEELDHRGIDTLEALSLTDFQNYLSKTRNTICGRHPIAVLMASLETIGQKTEFSNQKLKCIKYDQSSQCERYKDSSVSYASMYVQIQ